MGTRNLTAVMHNGRYGIAQYGQWDGYPSGQGMTVLTFLRSMDKLAFAAKVDATKMLDSADFEALQKEFDQIGSGSFYKKYPALTRDTCADILDIVANAPDGIGLRDDINFAGDSLMCEWAYVIDLDKGTFEVFRGFNKQPLGDDERFAKTPVDSQSRSGYQQVKLCKSWRLDELPTDEAFLAMDEESED